MATTYEHIQSYTASGTVTLISLNSIPQNYTDLKIIINTLKAGANMIPVYRFNSDSSSIYSGQSLNTSRFLVSATQPAVTTRFYLNESGTDQNNTVTYEIDVMGYTSSTKSKTVIQNTQNRLVTGGNKTISVGLFNSTSAITSLQVSDVFGDGFIANTNVQIYGILKA